MTNHFSFLSKFFSKEEKHVPSLERRFFFTSKKKGTAAEMFDLVDTELGQETPFDYSSDEAAQFVSKKVNNLDTFFYGEECLKEMETAYGYFVSVCALIDEYDHVNRQIDRRLVINNCRLEQVDEAIIEWLRNTQHVLDTDQNMSGIYLSEDALSELESLISE